MSQETMPWELVNTFELTLEEAQAEWASSKKPIGKGEDMTTQKVPPKTINAVLEAQGEQMKGEHLAFVYQVRRQGMNYPDFITWWPPKADPDGPPPDVSAAPRGILGRSYCFVVEVKSKGEGKKGVYYDLISLGTAQPASPTAAAPKAQAGPQAPRSGPPEAQAEAPPRDGSPKPPRHTEASQQWIIYDDRQAALGAAVELAGYSIAQGEAMKSPEVLLVASKFADWLATGKLPAVVLRSQPQPAQAADAAKGETV